MHHDRYAASGISCICLIALIIYMGIERRGDKQEQKTTLSICMPFNGRDPRPEASSMQEELAVVVKMPPPENRMSQNEKLAEQIIDRKGNRRK